MIVRPGRFLALVVVKHDYEQAHHFTSSRDRDFSAGQ